MATHTYTLYPTKSAACDLRYPDTHISLGTSITLEAHSIAGTHNNGMLMKFDLSEIAGKVITSCKLHLYVSALSNEGLIGKIYAYGIGISDFDENAVTYSDIVGKRAYAGAVNFLSVGAYRNGDVQPGEMIYITSDTYVVDGNLGSPTTTTAKAATNKPYLLITAEDSTPTATDLKPRQNYITGDVAQRLSWAYANEAGGAQKAFNLQKSTDGTTWVDVSSLTTPNQYYDAPAGTFAAGTAYWRVKVTSQWDIQSEWSEVALVMVISAPATPTITAVDATPRPIVSWQSVGQQAYQVRIGSHDSGIVYGTDKSYKSPVYLPDGETPVMVRIMNQYRMWSGWAEMITTIAHAGVAAVSLRATHDNSDIYLDWTGAHDIYYVYRDGALIAKTRDKAYIDHMAIGAHDYKVRGATGDAYDLSLDVAVTACCKTAMIAEVGVHDWIYLKCKRQGKPSTSASITQQIAYQHYAGRELPVADITEYADEAYTFAYSVLHDTGALRGLLGKTVVIKTPRGECVIGVLESLPYERDRWATDYTLTIRAIDYKPGVTYDV